MDITVEQQPDITHYVNPVASGTFQASILSGESICKIGFSTFDTLGGNFSISKDNLPDLITFLIELNTELNPVEDLEPSE